MIDDLGFAVGFLLANGGCFAVVALLVLSVAVSVGFGLGRRSAFREAGREAVLAAAEDAAAPTVAQRLPSQRGGER